MSSDVVIHHQENYNSPLVIVILTIIILAFFFMGFFSIYLCRCCMHNVILDAWVSRHSPGPNLDGVHNGQSPGRLGLDPKIIETFPSFVYSSVKGYRREKYGLECAICLVEFSDEDMLRLLPTCCHVFHEECVDLWLEKRITCPVCRRNLDATSISSQRKSPLSQSSVDMPNPSYESDSAEGSFISIQIKDGENEDERGGSAHGGVRGHSVTGSVQDEIEDIHVEKFSRSNTTGHSMAKKPIDEDRFTLRLPDDVKETIIKNKHNPSKSCTTF